MTRVSLRDDSEAAVRTLPLDVARSRHGAGEHDRAALVPEVSTNTGHCFQIPSEMKGNLLEVHRLLA